MPAQNPGVPDPGTRPPKIDVGTGPGNAIVAGAQTALSVTPLGDLSDGLNAIRAWISNRHNWVRVMWFGGGVVMFAIGAAMLARPAAAPVARAVSTVVPAGKAATAVKAATS
jgi:hypothetical protein